MEKGQLKSVGDGDSLKAIFPRPYKGIQVNYCVSTRCENFGVSDYSLYELAPNTNQLNIYFCPKCGAYPQIIDNQAIAEMLEYQQYYHALKITSCPDRNCTSHQLAVHSNPEHYRSFGKTRTLKQRYQCKCCGSVFTDQLLFLNSSSEIQTAIFYGMLYSFGVRNICNKLSITAKSFYKHQNLMRERLNYFSHIKEEAFYRQRQDVKLTTSYQFIESNSVLMIATTEASSGYVLSFDTNLLSGANLLSGVNLFSDASLTSELNLAENESVNIDRHDASTLMSKYNLQVEKPPIPSGNLDIQKVLNLDDSDDIVKNINDKYDEIMTRHNYVDPTSDGQKLYSRFRDPIISPYFTSFAHALIISRKLSRKTRRCYFVKQDTMLRNAFLNSALHELQHSNDQLFYYQDSHHPLDLFDPNTLNIRNIGWWNDKWGFISQQDKTKAACHIKGQNLSKNDWSKLLETVDMQGVDNYLKEINRFFNGLGTSLNQSSLNNWLHIFTAYYNYCHPNKEGKTPAQLLGLIDRPITLGELLNSEKL